MQFTQVHADNLIREINAYFDAKDAFIMEVDRSHVESEYPTIYVYFSVKGQLYTADVYTESDGSVDWIY